MHIIGSILLVISTLTSANTTRYATISVAVDNLTTGQKVEQYREQSVVTPASVMKVLTTATALEQFGADYRLPTYLEYSGQIVHDTLWGNLYIRGVGDPTLGSQEWENNLLTEWATAIQQAGIHHIAGSIEADMSAFAPEPYNPAWLYQDCSNYYAPGIYGINYLDNTLRLILNSGALGTPATLRRTEPEIEGLQVSSSVVCTSTNSDQAYVYGEPLTMVRRVTGEIPAMRDSFCVKADIPNPGLLLAQHLSQQLTVAGIVQDSAPGYLLLPATESRQPLYTHYSPTLGEIIAQTNLHSNNLFAEALARQLGLQRSRPSTIAASTAFIRDFWKQRGVSLEGCHIQDGCGLAPQNALSARALVDLLTYMRKSSNWSVWLQSLPVSGQTGTLRSLGKGTVLEGRIHAKSGTIASTKCYAGYMDLANGQQLVFAILISSAQGTSRELKQVIENYLLDVYRANT